MGVYDRVKSILGLGLSLAKANFKLRNEGSYLGIFWYLLEPLLLFLILYLVRGQIVGTDIPNYAVYLIVGLITFNFFRGTTSLCVNSIRRNSVFIKSMKIPQESLVVSPVLQSIFSHLFEILVIVFILFYFSIPIYGIIFYIVMFGFFVLFVTGISFILSVVGVYIVDLGNVWRVFTTLVWFATPIFYFVSTESKIYFLNLFNPLFYFISAARDFLIYQIFPETFMIIGIAGFSFVSFILGIWIFEKFKYKFAEVL